MALFLEDSQKVTQKKIPIPQNAKKVFKAMEKVYEPYLDKAEGGHVLKSLASDKHYNNKGNNADNNGEKKKIDTVSVDDAKVRLHRMDKFSPNSIQYQMFGGELAKNIYKDGIEKARSVSTVDAVKPPKPTSNAEVKPAVVKTKEISTPNGKISYTVTAENKKPKKIYISEDAVRKIYEDYRQLKLPFKNDSGKGYDYKENYELYIDFLESIGKYGRLGNYTGEDYNDIIENTIQNAFNDYTHSNEWDVDSTFSSLPINDMFRNAVEKNVVEKYFNLPEEILNNIDNIEYLSDKLDLDYATPDEICEYLTDEGKDIFNKKIFRSFESYVENMLYDIKTNDRGLIYVEREISIPDIFKTQYDEKISPENDDYFKLLTKYYGYKGVGVCWSWQEGRGEAYCGESYNVGSSDILLKGWVRPDSIDWVFTMQINAQMGNSEEELRLKNGAIVEVDEIIINGYKDVNKGKNILSNPILIPA
jgi:hypothetical protein